MATKNLHEHLNTLEAERLILTIEVRNALLRQAKALLPEAVRQAKGKRGRPGNPALLRLIARLAMRPHQIERPK